MQGGTAQNKKRIIILSLILALAFVLPSFAYESYDGSEVSLIRIYNGPSTSDLFYVGIVPYFPDELSIDSFQYYYVLSDDVGFTAYFFLPNDEEKYPIAGLSASIWSTNANMSCWSISYFSSVETFGDWYFTEATVSNRVTASNLICHNFPIMNGYQTQTYADPVGDISFLSFDGYSLMYFPDISNDVVSSFSDSYTILCAGITTSEYKTLSFDFDTVLTDFLPSSFEEDSTNKLYYFNENGSLLPVELTYTTSVFTDGYGRFMGPRCVEYARIDDYGDLSFAYSVSGDENIPSIRPLLFAYREAETEGPIGAVTGLTITNPPLGVDTDFTAYAGSDLQCTAEITGTGDYNTGITWSVQYDPQYNTDVYPTISETGLLHLPSTMQAQTIIVVATSVQDSSIGDFVPVNILPPAVSFVTITPSSATAGAGENIQFSATVSGSNVQDPDVTWSVGAATSPSTRITRDGLLLVGSDETSPLLGVRATSNQDGSVYSTALVTVSVPAAVTGVTIAPDDITLNRGDTQQFTATVTGTGSFDSSVTWQITSVYSAGTSISANGLLTVSDEQEYDYIIIKATSTADPSFSATAYVFVEDALSDPMTIDLSVVERLLEEIKNYLKTLQHIFDRPHYFREFNMYTGKLNETEEQITGLTFNFYRFMQNMEEYVGSIAYTFANGAEVQIREDTTEGFDWFSLFFGKNSSSKVEETDFAGVSTLVNHTRDLFDTGFGFSDFFDLLDTVPFFTSEVGSSLDTTVHTYDFRDPDPFNMSILNDREKLLEEWRNKNSD